MTASAYWIIVTIWVLIFATVSRFYFKNSKAFGTTELLLVVLGLDAIRNIVENGYFGVYFGARYSVFPPEWASVLSNPYLVILPKIFNIVAGLLVLGVLLLRWLPAAISEREEAERRAEDLYHLAVTDGLTLLNNRRSFLHLADIEWRRCRRYDRPMSLLILDIDHFKQINDRHGHDAGDVVLKRVAELCRAGKRASDIAGRLGGEEFALLLSETEIEDAHRFAERLRERIRAERFAIRGDSIALTVSIGGGRARDCDTLAEMMRQADMALYDAKQQGRDRVCIYNQ